MTKRYGAALAAFLVFSGLCARTYAAVPGTLSYQGTLRNNGALVTGTVAMEFRITSADGVTQYWTSNSTNVPVAAGLFRYTLGIPNEAQFAAIPWKDITPYVQMVVAGNPFPREPLYASAYARHARTAESSTGTFTAYEGDIRISTSAGSKGLVFQDGTAQYTAAGWSVSGQNAVLSGSGNAGLGVASPQARLDVQAASPSGATQIWRNSSGVIKASVSVSGILYAPGLDVNDADANTASSGFKFSNFYCSGTAKLTVDSGGNLVCASDQTGSGTGNLVDTLGETLGAGSDALTLGMVNLGSVAIGLGAAVARLDVQATGSDAQFWRNSGGTVVSSMSAAGVLYADASGLRNLPAGADSLGSHTATQALDMAAFGINNAGDITASGRITSYSSVTVAGALGVGAARLSLAPGVELSSAPAAQYGGVYVSSHVFLPAGAKYYGDGSVLTALSASNVSAGTLADGLLSANVALLNAGQVFSGVNTFSSSVTVTSSSGAAMARLQFNPEVAISSAATAQYGGVYVSSHVYLPAGAAYYGAGTGLTGLNAANLSSGLLPDARLSANIPRLDAANIFTGSLTVSAETGAAAPKLSLASNVDISSSATAFHGGVGVLVSSNVFVLGFSSATRYYGDGSALTGIVGSDDLGDHTATEALKMASNRIDDAGDITSAGKITAYSSVTVASELGLGSPKLALSPGVEISSTSSLFHGGLGVYVSSNVFVAGISSATRYYGDGSLLTGITASDNLGTHIATKTLDMAGFDVVGVSTIAVSSMTSSGIGVVVSTNLLVMGGNLGVNIDTPQARLHVNGGIMSSSLSGSGDQCVYADDTGELHVSGGGLCGSAAGLDNLGNHTMTQNLKTGANLIANSAVSVSGISINASDNVGIGLPSAGARLDVQPATVDSQFWRTVGGVVIASMSSTGVLYAEASGLRGLTLATTLIDGNSAGGIGVTNLGSVAIGLGAAAAQLDVQASGVNVQFWRDSGGTIVSSMTDTGVLYAEASGLRGLTLATTLADGNNAGGADVTNLGNLGVGRAATVDVRLDIQAGGSDEYMQVWRAPDGTVVSSMSAGGVLYSEASGLRGLPVDGLGAHTATQDLNMGGFTVDNAPKLVLTANVDISSTPGSFHGGVGVQVSTNVFIVGIASATKFYGDGSALTGVTGMVNPAIANLDMDLHSIFDVDSLVAGSVGATNMNVVNLQAGSIAPASGTQPFLQVSTHVYMTGHTAVGNAITAPSTFSALTVHESYPWAAAGGFGDVVGLDLVTELAPTVDNWAFATGASFIASMPDGNAFDAAMLRGVYSIARARNSGNLLYASGVIGGVTKTNPGTLNEAFGGYFSVNMGNTAAASNIINAYGIYTMNYIADPEATINNLFGVYVDSPTNQPSQTLNNMTNNYGVYINDQSGFGTAKSYNLYSAGAASKNYLQGKTGIGVEPSAAVTAPLQLMATGGDGNAIRMNNGASWCDLRVSLGDTCPAGTLLGTHNLKSLCLVCGP